MRGRRWIVMIATIALLAVAVQQTRSRHHDSAPARALVTTTTAAAAPGVPGSVGAQTAAPVHIEWQPSSGSPTAYSVYRSLTGLLGSFHLLGTVPAAPNVPMYAYDDLKAPLGPLWYRVKAFNGNGSSATLITFTNA
jgi:hypothetical protein